MQLNAGQLKVKGQTHQGILLPCDTLRLIRFRVGEPVDLTGLPPKKTVKVRSDLVAFIGAEGMALRASCLEANQRAGIAECSG